MALPFLPGNVFNRNLGKEKFHKSQIFEHKNTISFMFGDSKPGIGGDPLPGQRQLAPLSRYPLGEGPTQPAWLAFDKQVLSFDAYYQEAVVENREETFRIREVKIYFYLEDDSIQVIEPRIKNSGLPQGTKVRRHRITRPSPHEDLFYMVHDFNVGLLVNFYNIVYKIIGCDEFTHNFLRKLGVKVGLPEKPPEDVYSTNRKAMAESMQPLRPYEKFDQLRQFLDHDRHVLRFYCFWDDTESLHGDSREMLLHYFLADDTIEIQEVIKVNAGRDSGNLFLRRQKLPKKMDELPLPGDGAPRTVLNVFGKIQGGRYILDSLKTGAVHIEYYKDCDLTIGTYVNVFGRKFVICDCDPFTKEYYRNKYGITEFKTIDYKINKSEALVKENPPFNGWGSVEDSFGNCHSLLPKPPKRDFEKFLEKDRKGLESHILRYRARMETDNLIDQERSFIISYFLSDDTISIFEPKVNNSGILGGTFLERGTIKKPDQDRFSLVLPEYFSAQDLYVGARLNINGFIFFLDECDEYAWDYMEQNSCQFPMADVSLIREKLRRVTRGSQALVRDAFLALDPHKTGMIHVADINQLLTDISKGVLSLHEIRSILRHYAERPVKPVDAIEILSVCQQQLRRLNFEHFDDLDVALSDVDRESSGRLRPEVIRSVCMTLHLPVPDELLKAVIHLSGIDEDGFVKYSHFLCNIDWRHNPVKCVSNFSDSTDKQWIDHQPVGSDFRQVQNVVYTSMIEDILIKERIPREVVYN